MAEKAMAEKNEKKPSLDSRALRLDPNEVPLRASKIRV
jgi:hypothetical protein